MLIDISNVINVQGYMVEVSIVTYSDKSIEEMYTYPESATEIMVK